MLLVRMYFFILMQMLLSNCYDLNNIISCILSKSVPCSIIFCVQIFLCIYMIQTDTACIQLLVLHNFIQLRQHFNLTTTNNHPLFNMDRTSHPQQFWLTYSCAFMLNIEELVLACKLSYTQMSLLRLRTGEHTHVTVDTQLQCYIYCYKVDHQCVALLQVTTLNWYNC